MKENCEWTRLIEYVDEKRRSICGKSNLRQMRKLPLVPSKMEIFGKTFGNGKVL